MPSDELWKSLLHRQHQLNLQDKEIDRRWKEEREERKGKQMLYVYVAIADQCVKLGKIVDSQKWPLKLKLSHQDIFWSPDSTVSNAIK